jgi:signal transduction histidine kinase
MQFVTLLSGLSDGEGSNETLAKTTVRFEIQDTGPAFPWSISTRSFQKFFRIPGSTAGAAGLGLSIAKEIVEAHGGEIGVESKGRSRQHVLFHSARFGPAIDAQCVGQPIWPARTANDTVTASKGLVMM